MNTKTELSIIAIFISALLLNSCSLIGFGIGAVVDKKKPKVSNINFDHIDTLELEKRIEIILKDGDTIFGRYNGIIPIYNQNYQLQYDSIKRALSHQVKLPNLNDTLLITYKKDKASKKIGLFKGIESQMLWCKYTYGDNYFSIFLDSIQNIVINNEYVIDSVKINNFLSEQIFPNFVHVDIDVRKGDLKNIELASIEKILIFDKRNRKFIGLGVGLAIDAIIAVIIINSSFDPPAPTSF